MVQFTFNIQSNHFTHFGPKPSRNLFVKQGKTKPGPSGEITRLEGKPVEVTED